MSSVTSEDVRGPAVGQYDDLPERQWEILLRRIKGGNCTPFLGPESGFGSIPPASEVAKLWALKSGYPLEDQSNLPRVAQFRMTEDDADENSVREDLALLLEEQPPPDFRDPEEPHRILADLPFKVYINTHYRNFIFQALEKNPVKRPVREYCRCLDDRATDADLLPTLSGYIPEVHRPLVYYLFGHVDEPSSMVLTEDDYLDFLVRTSVAPPKLIPGVISSTFANDTLLFLGYQFADLDFRVILRKLESHLRRGSRRHLTVQAIAAGESAPGGRQPEGAKVQVIATGESAPGERQIEGTKAFLSKYCSKVSISFVAGSTRDFVRRLKRRWENS